MAESAGFGVVGAGLMSAAGRPPKFIHHRQAALQPTESQGADLCSALTCPLTVKAMRTENKTQHASDLERTSGIEGSGSTEVHLREANAITAKDNNS